MKIKIEYLSLYCITLVILLFCASVQYRWALSITPAIFLTAYILCKRFIIPRGVIFFLGINFIWVAYSTINYHNIISLELHFKAVFEMYLWILSFYILFHRVDRNHKCLFEFLILLSKSFSILSLIQLILFLVFNSREHVFSGFFDNRNDYAVLASFFLAIQVFLIKKKNASNYVFELIIIMLILSTLSTKGVICIAIIYFFYFKNNFNFLSKITLIPLFFIVFFFVLSSNESMRDRITDKIDSLGYISNVSIDNVGNDSGKIRILLYISAIQHVEKSPYFGVGINNAQFYMPVPKTWINITTLNTQNNYCEMALNAGIPGLIIYYTPFLLMIIFFLKRRDIIANLCITIIVMKLFNDFGMKSYNEAVQLFPVMFTYYIYSNRIEYM